MRREPNLRPENQLALALAEIERLKALMSKITDGRQLVINPGTTLPGAPTTPQVEAAPHVLYGSKHIRSLSVTAGAGLNINFEQGQAWINGTFFSIVAGSLVMVDATTNYVFVDSTGAVASNTTGFPDLSIPLAAVVTAGGAITSVNDRRSYLTPGIHQADISLGNPLIIGVDDTTRGEVHLMGDGPGSTEGGEVRLYLAADHDATFQYWTVDVFQDDLRFFRSDAPWTNEMTAEGLLTLGAAAGGLRAAGHGRFGSVAAPANVTAGDLTATRLLLGTDTAFPAANIRLLINAADTLQFRIRNTIAAGDGLEIGQDTAGHSTVQNSFSGGHLSLIAGGGAGILQISNTPVMNQGLLQVENDLLEFLTGGATVRFFVDASLVRSNVDVDIRDPALVADRALDIYSGYAATGAHLRLHPLTGTNVIVLTTDTTYASLLVGAAAATEALRVTHADGIVDVVTQERVAGYLRVGSLTAPASTTAGHVSASQILVGDDIAMPSGGGVTRTLEVNKTHNVNPATAGAKVLIGVDHNIEPAVGSGVGDYRALNFLGTTVYQAAVTRNVDLISNLVFDYRHRMLGAIGTSLTMVDLAAGPDALYTSTPGNITALYGVRLTIPRTLNNPASSVTITTADAIRIASPSLGSGPVTVTTMRGLLINNLGVSGVGTAIGIDISKFTTYATAAIEFRNAGKMVYTPTTQTLAAATDTIGNSARIIELSNSTGASLTLTSTPTISVTGAQDGQLITLVNDDAADNIVLQDESGAAGTKLRLPGAANLTLGPRDTATFYFNAGAGEWYCIGQTNL